MKSEKLAGERTELFTGETLRGLLLQAWGWGQIGSIAVIAGILLIVFGAHPVPAASAELAAEPQCGGQQVEITAGSTCAAAR